MKKPVMNKLTATLFCCGMMTSAWAGSTSERTTIGLENIQIEGDLQKRILRNFDRLESPRFQPIENTGCLREANYSWPGDMEGRTILLLAMLQQAVDREAKYLQQTMDLLPGRMNDLGYFGKNYFPKCDEQQLSGHGWYLRGLCELYVDRQDPKVKKMIEDVVDNLELPTQGKHKVYPIDPATRAKGKGSYSGEVVGVEGIEIWNAPFEGLYAHEVLIRDNRFIGNGVAWRNRNSWPAIWSGIFGGKSPQPLHRNIRILNNEFVDCAGPAMHMADVDGLVIEGNRITNPGGRGVRAEQTLPAQESIEIKNVRNASITGNTIEDFRFSRDINQ